MIGRHRLSMSVCVCVYSVEPLLPKRSLTYCRITLIVQQIILYRQAKRKLEAMGRPHRTFTRHSCLFMYWCPDLSLCRCISVSFFLSSFFLSFSTSSIIL